ncbi:dodecin family protein [Paucibacter sp. O1-1]|nr:dodecin family protein [Paucibacter sp. O1-1]MDA3830732.1 dodecin family protein [Paucibacter sp. O1-1]
MILWHIYLQVPGKKRRLISSTLTITDMSVVKVIEVLANSTQSWEDAAQTAVTEAAKSLKSIRSVYVKEFQAVEENDQITQYRINAKISLRIER